MNDKLIKLVASLSKSEKRNATLFINRSRTNNGSLKQLVLFDLIVQQQKIPIKKMLERYPSLSTKNIHELSVLLYRNILKSLSVIDSRDPEYRIRESIEFAHLLYSRGLFPDSLEILSQAKKKAVNHQKYFLVYEIIDFEKRIESRHVTKSHAERATELTSEAIYAREILEAEGHWTELSLQLYDLYLKSGHSRNDREKIKVEELFQHNWPQQKSNRRPQFYEQLYYFQSHVWYYYIIQNFPKGFQYAVKWIELFEQFPTMLHFEKFQLLKGYHNCLSVLFYCQDIRRFAHYQQKMEEFIEEYTATFDENTRMIAFIYQHLAKLNAVVMRAEFSESMPYLMELEQTLDAMENQLDHHRLMIFRYKMSTIYFTMGNHKKCIQLLNKIIHTNQSSLHEDVQSFARILNLIAHYELGNTELVFVQVKSVFRFMLKLNEMQDIQREIISFLRKIIAVPIDMIPEHLEDFYAKMLAINANKYENRAFLYLDILSWLESKIQNRLVEDVIRSKRSSK
jgi:hypothetical protein